MTYMYFPEFKCNQVLSDKKQQKYNLEGTLESKEFMIRHSAYATGGGGISIVTVCPYLKRLNSGTCLVFGAGKHHLAPLFLVW